MTPEMMACGHAANATSLVDGEYVPTCAICMTTQAADAQPDLTGRRMQCVYWRGTGGRCTTGEPRPSRQDAAFFEYRPGHLVDLFYCGCFGWD